MSEKNNKWQKGDHGMKALVYTGAKKAEVREVPEPQKKEGTIRLEIQYCGVCGSDVGIWLGTHPR